MAAKYQPDAVVYYEGEDEGGTVVWVDEPVPEIYLYKVLWWTQRYVEGEIEADALYGAWYSEARLDDEPRPMDKSLF